MASDRDDDDLARTATAPVGSPSAPATPAAPIGATLGRYRLERELGAGGMGVVHAAFDPDLERRVALKVLRTTTGDSGEAHKRLLREARAMARLAHPHVVTVHEVGTADGRDYVAMELVEGETLADWLRSAKRPAAEIVDAFIAAGRGLAAAHAAEIVHRDFKPHNVLRSREGRIAVTDFGLAREAQPDVKHDPMAETMPLKSTNTSTTSTPSSLSGLTVTGSVLGTPAYMAPEQWSGGAVTPATDQFAYCVALWEALAGERPYRGLTAEALRAEVGRGPAAIDASKIPRKLRPILRRGLDPDPARRWPNMPALLAGLARASRPPGPILAIAGAAVLAVGVIYVVFGGASHPAALACELPSRDPAVVWSAANAAELRAKSADLAKVFDDDLGRWEAARTTACAAIPAERPLRVKCLDGVLARIEMWRQLAGHYPTLTSDDVAEELVEPTVCNRSDPPLLKLEPSADVMAALELRARASLPDDKPADTEVTSGAGTPDLRAHAPLPIEKLTEADVTAVADRPGLEPCARAIAMLARQSVTKDRPRAHAAITEATSAAEQCADDRLRADVLLRAFPYEMELPLVGPKGQAAIKRAEVAVKRVAEPALEARVKLMRSLVASQQEHWKESFELIEQAIVDLGSRGLQRRQLGAVLGLNQRRSERDEVADVEAIRATIAKWKPIAEKLHDDRILHRFALEDAAARFNLGDVAGSHPDLVRLHADAASAASRYATHLLEGDVVDQQGKPVPGATVAAAMILIADTVGIGVPMSEWDPGQCRTATTDAAGHFEIADATVSGVVVAQLGDRRSLAQPIGDKLKLVLEPTRRVDGTVALGSVARTKLFVVVEPGDGGSMSYQMVAPIKPDGSFELAGVPVAAIKIGVAMENHTFGSQIAFKRIEASPAAVTGISLAVPTSTRTLDVLARSTLSIPLDVAQVLVLPGKQKVANVGDLKNFTSGVQSGFARPIVGEAGGAAKDRLQPGDLVAHFTTVEPGDLTVCAIGLMGDLADPKLRETMQKHSHDFEIRCEQIDGATQAVVVQTPPQKRFD